MNYLLRRKGHGKEACEAITFYMVEDIEVKRSDRPTRDAEVVFRWGCTAPIAAQKIVNTIDAIKLVGDKTEFRKKLGELAPKTWYFGNEIEKDGKYVVRPRYHSGGQQLYYVESVDGLTEAWRKVGVDGYVSEFIPKVAEYRVFAAQGRAICVARKTVDDPTAIAWNHQQGGHFSNVKWSDWPLKVVRVSLEAFKLSGLDFGGVDVMVDKDGKVYVLEINSGMAVESEYRQQCFAKVFDYMIENGTDPIPLVDRKGDYKKFVHPTIYSGAIV